MGKVVFRPIVRDVVVAEMTAEEYDEMVELETLEDELDAAISNAITDFDYDLFYEED